MYHLKQKNKNIRVQKANFGLERMFRGCRKSLFSRQKNASQSLQREWKNFAHLKSDRNLWSKIKSFDFVRVSQTVEQNKENISTFTYRTVTDAQKCLKAKCHLRIKALRENAKFNKLRKGSWKRGYTVKHNVHVTQCWQVPLFQDWPPKLEIVKKVRQFLNSAKKSLMVRSQNLEDIFTNNTGRSP